jgi:hypothetical protein
MKSLVIISFLMTVIDSTSFTTQQDIDYYKYYYRNKILFNKYVTQDRKDFIINETLCKTIQSMFNDE